MMMEVDLAERITRLEEKYAAHVELAKSNFEELKTILAANSAVIAEQTAALNKYKGFWGAIALIGSAISALVVLVKERVFSAFFGHS